MTTDKLRRLFIDFYKNKGHQEIPSSSLLPNDPTTLFTGSGMQPLIPYLLGKTHPMGRRLVNSQKCFRAQDIEEVGDNRHTTFFEMLGNWSLGDYFKKEQLFYFFTFLTEVLGLEPERLYVTVFQGEKRLSKDVASITIWQQLFRTVGIEAKEGQRIFCYPADKNWWSRTGEPDTMPAGEPGGPDSEVFFDFKIKHDKKYGPDCHPNCDCGRFLEIGNSVFMEYIKEKNGSLDQLKQKNVDFGGGLERLLAACQNKPDIFAIDSFYPIIEQIETVSQGRYRDEEKKPLMRTIADHLKAATFLIIDGVYPSNKEQGYVLRRLLRRSVVKLRRLSGNLPKVDNIVSICEKVINLYQGSGYIKDVWVAKKKIESVVEKDLSQFGRVLSRGVSIIQKQKRNKINASFAFDLYQSYGIPFEITQELVIDKGIVVDRKQFDRKVDQHKNISRHGANNKFAGGLDKITGIL